MEVVSTERTITELDHVRLTNLIHRAKSSGLPAAQMQSFEDALDAAIVVPSNDVAPDVVTMYSRVLLKDPDTGERKKLTLCYPPDADLAQGFVSVLSPVGWSLLGAGAGRTVRWPTPSGEQKAGEVLEILFQPESGGDYSM